MTKYEFLYALRETLSNALNPSQVEEQVQYYADYIDEQVRMGYSEAQVLKDLGTWRWVVGGLLLCVVMIFLPKGIFGHKEINVAIAKVKAFIAKKKSKKEA